jgi:uncharacterized protein YjbI with pentapeptide repeats
MLSHENSLIEKLVLFEKEISDCEYENCTFSDCDFSNAVLKSVSFIDCVLKNCNLTMARLKNCQLRNVTFNSCKLLGVNFSNCIDFLFSVNFESCVLDYSSFVRKKMIKTSFLNSSVKNVDFTECDLTRSIF